MILEGQKWACQSCIRGHRVSNCTHADRDLFPIAPKGRPVKQCEHCRSARKDKSHHAKCNCGNKKHKDLTESGPKIEGFGCCCRQPGSKCVCGIKSEANDLRIQEALIRRPVPVKSRPSLETRNSESVLTTGHPKLQHRNTFGHTSGQPYNKLKRPVSLHGTSFNSSSKDYLDQDATPRAVDDMLLLNNNPNRMYGMGFGAQLSADNLQVGSPTGFNSGCAGFDFNNIFGTDSTTGDVPQLFQTTSGDGLSQTSSWFDSSLTTVAEAPGDFTTSPTGMFGDFTDNDWNIPSATSDFFSPADLPLTTSQTDFSQTISHSGESNHQSVPGLTASSSGAQSEIDGPTDSSQTEAFPNFWSGVVQFRESTPLTSGSTTTTFPFPASLPAHGSGFKPTSSPKRHRQTYSFGSTHHHAYTSSDSTTVPDEYTSNANVNIGHLQNLATLKSAQAAAAARASSQSPTEFPQSTESDLRAITIPAGTDDGYDWDFPIQPPEPSEQSRQFAWLLDNA